MPQCFIESRPEFTFDDHWQVVQWDQEPLYRASGGFGSLPQTLASDFVGLHPAAGVHLFELKNFAAFHHENREKLADAGFHSALAGKVRDTLAGAVWARDRSHDHGATASLLKAMVERWVTAPPQVRVVLWIEDVPAVAPPVAEHIANAVHRALKRMVGIKNVRVLDMASHARSPLPGLTVRPV